MILTVLIWVFAQAAGVIEDAISVVIPEAWLQIVRDALNDFATPILQAVTYWLTDNVMAFLATAVTWSIITAIARATIKAVKRLRGWA